MRGRPPKKTLTPDQKRAANAFVGGAESPGAGSGTAATVDAPPVSASTDDGLPWEGPLVREDVVKGYALRLPEPLYLKLKWVAEQTGRSVNTVIREAVTREVDAFLGGAPETDKR